MIELPEAVTLAAQLENTIAGRRVERVEAAASPHKFAFFFGDPAEYGARLKGRTALSASSYGGRVEIDFGGLLLEFNDGVNITFTEAGAPRPQKHQLLVEFEGGSALVCTVAMYGGLLCFAKGELDNFYYNVAREKFSPLSPAFDRTYFDSLLEADGLKLSAKAFLATGQRIPGLGNGVLQDILFSAGIHPKRKMSTLDHAERTALFESLKATLAEMTALGGRDTEKDLFGRPGGYKTRLGKNTKPPICPVCGGEVVKASYMGGSIYFCQDCQKI